MAYIPNEWKDQVVQRPKTYQMNNNDDGSVTLIDSFGLVTELGTPVNQDYMNHIEQGIAGCAIRYYSTTETFKDKEAVLNVNEDGDIELWQSLADNNTGNPLTDETKWKKAGIGADTDLSNLTAEGENHFTNKNLTNLTAECEKHFLNKNQLANCILEAPNGVATYSGTTITVKQGLKVLIPNGRNADGTMNNIEYTLPQDLTYTNPFAYNSEYYLWLTYSNGTCAVTGASTSIPFLAQEEQPDIFFANNCIWYKPSENLIYFTANYPTTPFTPVRVCFLGKFTSTASNTVTSFTAYPTLEIIKRTDPEIQAPYVYRSYRNGNSWYKLWSDGFIEQGGIVSAAKNGDVVTFLQPYSTVVLDIQLTCIWIGSNYNSGYNTATRQNFKFYTAMPSNIAEGVAVNWYSCGY